MLLLAASYEGVSLSAFIRKAALEAACSVIERNERFVLGREDAKVIIASFEQPLVPNEALCKAMMTAERIGTSLILENGWLKNQTVKNGAVKASVV